MVAPALNTEIEATDADADPLTFDVYFDTNENPTTKVSENKTETTYNATGLTAATKYYFKVVIKDDKGASSIGQVWSFTTK